MAETKLRKAIKNDLRDQILARNGGVMDEATEDMIETYMDMWDCKEGLTKDIEKRGTKVVVTTSTGTKNTKTNDSVQDLNKLVGQMLKMRAQMHLDEPAPKVDDLDDEM
jgi:hypothetical protein